MVYGLFIGLIISGLIVGVPNSDLYSDDDESMTIGRHIICIVSLTIVIVSLCGLLGLIIRGA